MSVNKAPPTVFDVPKKSFFFLLFQDFFCFYSDGDLHPHVENKKILFQCRDGLTRYASSSPSAFEASFSIASSSLARPRRASTVRSPPSRSASARRGMAMTCKG